MSYSWSRVSCPRVSGKKKITEWCVLQAYRFQFSTSSCYPGSQAFTPFSASPTEWLQALDGLACVHMPHKLWAPLYMWAGHAVNSTVPTVHSFWKANYLFQSLMTWLRKATEPCGSQRQSSPWVNQKASLTKGSKKKLAPAQPTFSALLRNRTPSCEFIDSPLRSSNGINFAFLVPAN